MLPVLEDVVPVVDLLPVLEDVDLLPVLEDVVPDVDLLSVLEDVDLLSVPEVVSVVGDVVPVDELLFPQAIAENISVPARHTIIPFCIKFFLYIMIFLLSSIFKRFPSPLWFYYLRDILTVSKSKLNKSDSFHIFQILFCLF